MAAGHMITYSLALWSGLYLLNRNGHKPAMRYTGLGLVAYAVGVLLISTFARTAGWLFVGVVPALCWLVAIFHFWRSRTSPRPPRWLFWWVIVVSIMLAISFGGLLLPEAWFNSSLVLLAIGLDLLLLGYGIAMLDAYDEGEAFLPHALRSLLATVVLSGLLGGQVILAMAIQGHTITLDFLLVGMILVSVCLSVFAATLQQWLDVVAFGQRDTRQEQRGELRAIAEALPRSDESLNLLHMDAATFDRHTRRALSNLGNLPRLTTSPLMHLPLLDERLHQTDEADQVLVRAAALKRLLTERINHLKPPDSNFGVTDEWRFYNALYYPYVAGFKPYSRRTSLEDLNAQEQAVMAWFRSQVPERTLYNWQNAAAKLIAQDLRKSLTP